LSSIPGAPLAQGQTAANQLTDQARATMARIRELPYRKAMRSRFAPILGVILSLALTLASFVHASTDGRASFWAEVCGADGVTLVALDENGNPAAPHGPCPDCLAPYWTNGPAPVAASAAPGTSRPLAHADQRQIAARLPLPAPVARGPPVLI
jgi:hypothetical protein